MHLPAILQILVVFAGILLLHRLGVMLGLSLFIGALAIDLWAGRGPAGTLADLGAALMRPDMWLLTTVIALILELGRFMAADRNAAIVTAIARRVGGRHGRAVSVMTLPAIIGLVPMPGGALFSAPLVAQAVREDTWSKEWKSAVNYWFRHIWEYWWPLYPVVILTLSIFTLETWQYMAAMIPFSLVSALSGYLFLVRPHLHSLAEDVPPSAPFPPGAWMLVLPLVLIIGAALLLPPVVESLAPAWTSSVRKLVAMLVGMTAAVGLIFWEERHDPDIKPFQEILKKKSVNILLTLPAVLIFQTLLDRSGLIPQAAAELVDSGIPLLTVVAILPFVAGLVTGIAIGFAGTSFPLVLGLISQDGSGLHVLSTLSLAFGFGYAGMMLSPVHLCLVLTKDYFQAPFARVYRHILPCVFCTMLAAVVLCAVFASLGW